MKTYKRYASILLIFTMLIATLNLAGCSKNEEKQPVNSESTNEKTNETTTAKTTEENEATDEDVVTIKMATSGSSQEMAIRETTGNLYIDQNKNVNIEWIDLGSDRFQKLMTLIGSGTAPDILYINEFAYAFAEKGVLEPLDSYIENDKDFDLSIFYEGLIDPLKWEDNLYAIPQEVSPFVIYYNKDMFDEANIDYPTDDWTKEEFLEIAKKLTNKEKKIYGYRHPESSWYDQFTGWMAREGVSIYSDDLKDIGFKSEKALSALQFLYDMVYVNKVSPDPASIQAMGKGFDALFRNGKVAMDSAGLWKLPDYKNDPLDFKWDIVRMPKGTDNQNTKVGTLNWAISSDSKHKDLAWDIIKFFVGPVGMEEVAKSQMAIPSTRDEKSNQIILDSKYPENVKAFIDSAEEVDLSDQKSSKRNEVLTAVGNELDAMLFGNQTPEETQKNIIDKGHEIMTN